MKIMLRNRQRKSTIGMFTEKSMKEAVVMVIVGLFYLGHNGHSVRFAPGKI